MSCLILSVIVSGVVSGCRKSDPSITAAKAEPLPVVVSVTHARLRDMNETVTAQGTLSPVQGGAARV
ncbi:MAG: hypothetical protein H8F28_05340, partial [Fibrella sp.]|nr:hypothetical protein [Armatimonadota bacterium]